MLKSKILFTIFIIFIFRVLANIPVFGVNVEAVRAYLSSNEIFGMFNIFSGGGFSNFSLVTLGLGPYINASIIMQIFTVVVPKLEQLLKEEGEYGREKINQYTKMLTIPIAALQSYGVYFLLTSQNIIEPLTPLKLVVFITTIVAGTMLLVWLGDLLTEKGIGNGISMLIFVGIIESLPTGAAQLYLFLTTERVLQALGLILGLAVLVFAIVLVNEAVRNIPVEYGRKEYYSQRNQGVTSYLPIKINQAGVIPIIFAVSIVMLPSLISQPLVSSGNELFVKVGIFFQDYFSVTSFLYNLTYFLLVVGFTYFYTSFQFDPAKISDDIKKRGGFIPGVRPGKNTTDYLRKVINRITFGGAIFLGVIAILPNIAAKIFSTPNLGIGGSGLLIVVSVVLETIRQVKSIRSTKSYEAFLS